MSEKSSIPDAFWPLLDAVCDETLTDAQYDQLAAILEASPEARRTLLDHTRLQTDIRLLCDAEAACDRGLAQIKPQATTTSAAVVPVFATLGTAARGVGSYFSEGWPLAYLITSIVFAIAAGVGVMWKVSTAGPTVAALQNQNAKTPSEMSSPLANDANESAAADKNRASAAKKVRPIIVGRITDEADCQWKAVGSGQWTVDSGASGERKLPVHEALGSNNLSDKQGANAPRSPTSVAFGDKFLVASGLLEITFNTGAKVILEGPCTFRAERNGGFLTVGRLTGRMEKKPVGSGQWAVDGKVGVRVGSGSEAHPEIPKSQNPKIPASSNPQSPIPNPFVIATPTAVVTDLGTEFGVEVDRSGVSDVHVLKGEVQAKFLDGRGQVFKTVSLRQGEARHYDRTAKRVTVIPVNVVRFSDIQSMHREDHRFDRWMAYSRQLRKDPTLVAYYPFEASNAPSSFLKNASPSGDAMDGRIMGARWANGRLPGKASLWFANPGDHVALPHPERFNFSKEFSVVLWMQLQHHWEAPDHALIAKGNVGWRILQRDDMPGLTFDTNSGKDNCNGQFYNYFGRSAIDNVHWHQIVAVYQSNKRFASRFLYVDGELTTQGDLPNPLVQNKEPVWIGNNRQRPDHAMAGWIDEVAIFSRALSPLEIKNMYDAGDPALWSSILTPATMQRSP